MTLIVVRTILMRREIREELQSKVRDLDPGLLSTAESFGVFFTALVDIFTVVAIAIALHILIKLVFLVLKRDQKRKIFNDVALGGFYLATSIFSMWSIWS